MLFGIFVVIFVIVCLFLVLLVLIQSDKGGGISGSIGGGLAGANTLLGAQDTANILTRGTTIFAVSYMVLCIFLSLVLSRTAVSQGKSELKKRAETEAYAPSSVLQGGGLPLTEEGEGTEAPAQGQGLPVLPTDEE
jgi:preprotein translocase subunit SecG